MTNAPDGSAALDALLEAIASDDFETRETASLRLESLETISIEEIEDRLAGDDLSAEQRTRLDSAARRRFGAMPRAGLGVQFGAPRREDGVELGAVLPNFPAATVLRAGDVVLSIEGVPVRDTTQMGAFILSHRPGETLSIVIERSTGAAEADGIIPPPGVAEVERIALDVPLGSYEDLQTNAPLTPDRIEAAYRRYQFRKGLLADGGNAEVGGGLTPLGWLKAEGYDHTRPGGPVVPGGSFEAVSAWRQVGFAGQPRSWIATVDLRRGDPNAMARRVLRGLQPGLQADGIYDRLEEALSGYRAMLDRVVEIDRMVDPSGEGRLPDPARLARVKAERDELVQGLDELAAEMAEPLEPSTSLIEIDSRP